MMIKKARTSALPLPGRLWVYRASLVMMVAFGLTLLVISKTGNPAATRLRTSITDMAAPVLAFAASPMDALHVAGAWMGEMARLREENVALKNQNAQLLQWQALARSMQAENDSLHGLLKVVPQRKTSYITARVVSDLGGPYVHSALIDGGSDNGIKKDEAALGENGLMGRVVDVGSTSARVLLLSDINSRVPVIAEHAREKSILSGNNTDFPALAYLAADSKIKVGERIVTSGDGGVFPRGIPVGVVTSVDKGVIKVQPFVDAASVEYVSVVDYAF